ncbi:MAG: 4-alpha-glucanotransferase [bacterium]
MNPGQEVPLLMNYLNKDLWSIVFNVDKKKKNKLKFLNYSFVLKQHEDITLYDCGKHRCIDLDSNEDDITIIESWNDMGTISNVFNTAPFKNVFFKNKQTQLPQDLKRHFHFSVEAPTLIDRQKLVMTGDTTSLGNWLSSGYIEMQFDGKKWFVELDTFEEVSRIEYKYCIVSCDDNSIVYELGANRILNYIDYYSSRTIVNDGYLRIENYSWRGTGVAVPVFSLRTKRSIGVGDFNDLKKMVDWCNKTSIKMIQLLPVNDTTITHTWKDSYPYSSVSSIALHPLYISIEKIAEKSNLQLVASILEEGKRINEFTDVDYEAVMDIKWSALRILYDSMYESTTSIQDFQKFLKKNSYWLIPYAVFSYLRDKYKTADFTEWGTYGQFNSQMLLEIEGQSTMEHKECCFYYFVQYHLHKQLKEAHDYANKKGIILKGDIPIGVNRFGVETWTEPELFNLDMQAGAPPDDFAVTGQNWGFPTYNWSAMKQDDYTWWRKRFQHLASYFDVFRIDHILGFFRIWSIPSDQSEGIMGRFVPAIPIMKRELTDLNIVFEMSRFCEPYITDAIIAEIAENYSEEIKEFLEFSSEGNYRLKSTHKTQKAVELHFRKIKSTEKNKKLKSILFSLISNVIFFNDPDDVNAFHFRFNMANTPSFKHLDKSTKQKLTHLYNDYFYYRQDQLWRQEAMEKLPALKTSTDMLLCGEDLGFIPRCVPDVMQLLGLLSLEVQRMPKIPNHQFVNLTDVRYLSVVTPSTHDISTIRAWWQENRILSQQFYTDELAQHGIAPNCADPTIIQSILLQHLSSNAQWAVFQIQDLLAINEETWVKDPKEERINIPEDPNHCWKYRMNIGIEELLKNNDINNKLKFLIESSGRV